MQRTRKNMPKKTPNFVPFVRREEREEDMQISTSGGKKGDVSRNMLKPQGMT
jgi:hypothetical protein